MAVALRDAERDRAEARAERERSGEELTASQILFTNADRHEREALGWAERDWNSGDFAGADIADFHEFERRDDDWKRAAEATGESRAEGDEAGLDYDSSERRRRFAASLEGKADQKTIDARILADGENAKHRRQAVRSQPGRAAKPRKKAKVSCSNAPVAVSPANRVDNADGVSFRSHVVAYEVRGTPWARRNSSPPS